jgi:hypothetical protein
MPIDWTPSDDDDLQDLLKREGRSAAIRAAAENAYADSSEDCEHCDDLVAAYAYIEAESRAMREQARFWKGTAIALAASAVIWGVAIWLVRR